MTRVAQAAPRCLCFGCARLGRSGRSRSEKSRADPSRGGNQLCPGVGRTAPARARAVRCSDRRACRGGGVCRWLRNSPLVGAWPRRVWASRWVWATFWGREHPDNWLGTLFWYLPKNDRHLEICTPRKCALQCGQFRPHATEISHGSQMFNRTFFSTIKTTADYMQPGKSGCGVISHPCSYCGVVLILRLRWQALRPTSNVLWTCEVGGLFAL